MIQGTFEIHIIVRPEDQFHLFAFCKDKGDALIRLRPTCAVTSYGKHLIQPMITGWFKGDEHEAIKQASSISQQMIEYGMHPLRIKVEAMAHSEGIPDSDFGDHYFEFHFKIQIKGSSDWLSLAKDCATHGAHLFFNPYSQTGQFVPVITLRVYDEPCVEGEQRLDRLILYLNEKQYKIEGGIEREYSVLDTNVMLDDGWLFDTNPRNFILNT
jgi:hypothetical protein